MQKMSFMVKRISFFLSLVVVSYTALAQKPKSKGSLQVPQELRIGLDSQYWEFPTKKVEFLKYRGVSAMRILTSTELVILKDLKFSDGTIEFDIEPQDPDFTGIYFRMESSQETEYFYLRVARAGNPVAMDAVQYAGYNKGVNLWDLLGHYQAPANFKRNEWNHIKLVISGRQMIVYVNDTTNATLEVSRLEGNTQSGSLAFNGKCVIANLVVKPMVVEGLSPNEGFDPTRHDPRIIRFWKTSEPQFLPNGRELYDGELPKPDVTFKSINSERRGLVNLTRLYGKSESRRFVWLKATLNSSIDQKKKINLGFSDEVWVFVNRRPVFVDKNLYRLNMRKYPDGRISTENSSFEINLIAGENELLIGVANDFFGWGIIAQLNDMNGVSVAR